MFGWLAQEPDLGPWVERGGIIGLLASAVIAFLRGWIVPGATHRQVLNERDRAVDAIYKYAEIATRAIEAAERKT